MPPTSLPLTQFKTSEKNPEYSLLDSAASVHVFHTKSRFANFRKSSRDEGLLCWTNYVPIEGWGNVSLPLQIGNQSKLLILKKVTLVTDFPLNLVSLACLEDQGYDWSHRSGEIRNGARIVGTTVRNGNNFEIGQTGRILGTALTTLTAKDRVRNDLASETSKPRSKAARRQRLNTPASSDTWHRRMGHIGPLGLHKLGKERLGVSLRPGKSMAQCPHCALSKITQQISRIPPANKVTRPFHRVYIDWLDLEEGWDGYQGDGALVRRVMVAVCEATGMAMTYFTQSSKESENLPLVTDFVTFLALRYNLEVKVIRSDNELNRIKTRAWCESVGISLELCAPDTHAQNGGAERFGRLIVEKARAMRLSANLPHRL